MFTGLIETTARVASVAQTGAGARLRVATPLAAELSLGESVSVNGTCLTVVDREASHFDADVSPETLRRTTLGAFEAGRLVNLERPLRADGRIGGHFVLGHVDHLGRIARIERQGDSYWLDIDAPSDAAVLLVSKGSVAVDGISLTVAALAGSRFGVQIVPFTWQHTALCEARVGDVVNLETDVIGKYVARLLEAASPERT